MKKKKQVQVQQRSSASKLGFADVKEAISLYRKLQEKITELLDSPSDQAITPSQIDAVTRYLKEQGLNLSELIKDRSLMECRSTGEDYGDSEGDSEVTRLVLPFTRDEHGNSIPNPAYVPADPTPPADSGKRIGDSDLI